MWPRILLHCMINKLYCYKWGFKIVSKKSQEKENIFAALSFEIKKYVGCLMCWKILGNLKFGNFKHSGYMQGQERYPLQASALIILNDRELEWACKTHVHWYGKSGSNMSTHELHTLLGLVYWKQGRKRWWISIILVIVCGIAKCVVVVLGSCSARNCLVIGPDICWGKN